MLFLKSIINAYLAYFIYLFSSKRQNIWLIGGHNGNLYTDNSKVFYEYIVEKYPNIDIYWIVNKDAPVYNQIIGKKIIKGSIRSYYYFYQSRVSLFSDTINSDIVPFLFVMPFLRKLYLKNFKVYLGHGTIALKKNPKTSFWTRKIKKNIFKSYNLATASTELEKHVMEKYGISKSAIVLTGSARNDCLKIIPNKTKNILIIPTWRSWLYANDTLIGTDFYKYYLLLLRDVELHEYLEYNKIYVKFYLHHMFHKFSSEFKSLENTFVEILDPNAVISEYIQTSDLMITDYSSASADFYYLHKPVLFFQFDLEEYLDKTGSEIDLENTQFGDVSYDVNSLVKKLMITIERKYTISSSQKEGEKYFVHFKDKHNCDRIYTEILNRTKKD